jgi:muramidase (phage lysozyme)
MTKEEINVQAFLKLIRWCEHKREDDTVYFILFGGGRFTGTDAHPNIVVRDKLNKPHTPAGAYQITYVTWAEAKQKGIVSDFTNASQDAVAIWLIKQKKALDDVQKGDLDAAIPKLGGRWSSLPGASQSHVSMETAKEKFNKYVKEYSTGN